MNKVDDSGLVTATVNQQSYTQDLVEAVKQKTKSFDPTSDGDDRKTSDNMVGLKKLIFTFTTGKDKCLLIFSLVMVSIQGAAMPTFMIAFGHLVDAVGGDVMTSGFDMLNKGAIYMVIIGFVTFLVSFAQIAGFSLFAAKNAH